MRAIIDEEGLPHAAGYYRMFPREPSASPGLDMTITTVEPVSGITLEVLLDRLIAAAGLDEREALVVAHGEPRGLLMPVAAGGVSAMKDALQVIAGAGDALDRAAVIRQMPESTDADRTAKLDAWRGLVNGLQPGAIQGQFSLAEAKRWFTAWVAQQAGRVGISPTGLEQLVRKREQVREARFHRIEIRACNIGQDQTSLAALRHFLGAGRLLAPATTTFYATVAPEIVADAQSFRRWIQTNGGPATGGVYARQRGPSSRTFEDLVLPSGGFRLFTMFRPVTSFALEVWETSQHPHRFGTRAATMSPLLTGLWIDQHIMPGANAPAGGRFPLAGLWTFGKPAQSQPYLLPAEAAYRTFIVSDPPAGAAP